MPWYRSGTVAITAGQTSVVGTNTDFAANARVGDAFQGPDGRWYEVANIASATVLSILPAYQGATVSAGGYGLAPMQGYVKDSADALRAIVNQYGTKLAALGTTGNYDILPVAKGGTGGTTAADARAGLGLGSVATESILPVAKGGTGGSTQAAARLGLGLKSAAIADVVGTVSQSGGVSTGSIIERGSNGNGSYVKYADGTMECWNTGIGTGAVGASAPFDLAITYPAQFISSPFILASFSPGASWDFYGFLASYSVSGSSATLRGRNGATAQSFSGSWRAIGRWY